MGVVLDASENFIGLVLEERLAHELMDERGAPGAQRPRYLPTPASLQA
jgi:hypothetical protein